MPPSFRRRPSRRDKPAISCSWSNSDQTAESRPVKVARTLGAEAVIATGIDARRDRRHRRAAASHSRHQSPNQSQRRRETSEIPMSIAEPFSFAVRS